MYINSEQRRKEREKREDIWITKRERERVQISCRERNRKHKRMASPYQCDITVTYSRIEEKNVSNQHFY